VLATNHAVMYTSSACLCWDVDREKIETNRPKNFGFPFLVPFFKMHTRQHKRRCGQKYAHSPRRRPRPHDNSRQNEPQNPQTPPELADDPLGCGHNCQGGLLRPKERQLPKRNPLGGIRRVGLRFREFSSLWEDGGGDEDDCRDLFGGLEVGGKGHHGSSGMTAEGNGRQIVRSN
jgi:hypothetical protein